MATEQIITDHWFAIVNPIAGAGHGLTDYPQIAKLLRDNDIYHDAVFTEHKFHATELTVEAIDKGYRKIIVIGGDGTLNEVVNGLFIQQICQPKDIQLAVIAVGTGNDWVRSFGIASCYSEAIRAIKEGKTFLQDVGAVTYTESKFTQTRYMANVAGLGFDSFVISIFNHWKTKGFKGKWLYLASILKAYFQYKSAGMVVELDGKQIFNNLLFSIAVGICKFNGGGVQQLPKAVADDGLLDITLIRPVHWWHIVFRLSKLFNGGIYSIGHVQHAQGKHIRITSVPPVMLECDGELMGETPIDIEVIPQAVRVVVTKEFLASRK
ncbi:MAG: diacylglycerol kinase family lipid kinase [Alistipes sp.]|nr:diacylglycerol kinase family lipid kinase [Alistipes sp.]